jgi:DNA-binding response OmpR family regulator
MGTGSILIVEDDRELAAAMADALRVAGMARAVVVCDGVEALTWLHSEGRPAAVLLDLGLPRAHGYEIWRYMREDEDLKHVPTIVVTGAEVDPTSFQGVADILRKPVQLERLLAAVRRVLPAN